MSNETLLVITSFCAGVIVTCTVLNIAMLLDKK